MSKKKLVIGIMICMCIVLVVGVVKLNLKYKEENMAEAENIESEDENVDIEEETDIPPIKAPKKEDIQLDKTDNDKDIKTPEYKEEVKEIDGNKVLVKPTPTPKNEKFPQGMEKPKTQPKPTKPPKPVNTETANKKGNKKTKPKNTEKPPTYEKQEEESSIVEKNGKQYIKGVNGKLFPIDNDTDMKNGGIVDSSDLGEPGDPEMGKGDKFEDINKGN